MVRKRKVARREKGVQRGAPLKVDKDYGMVRQRKTVPLPIRGQTTVNLMAEGSFVWE